MALYILPRNVFLYEIEKITNNKINDELWHLLAALLPLLFMPPVGWHIAVELSVCLSVLNFNIGHNFCNIEDSSLIFVMHVYLIELHILSAERSRLFSQGKESYTIKK